MSKYQINQRFGRLTIIGNADKPYHYLCRCDCGNERIVFCGNLSSGHTQSCSCLQKEQARKIRTTHGMSKKHLLYRVWDQIKDRCNNPNHKFYQNYGGRGIHICDEWRNDFKSFYDWSICNGYERGLEIDRKNNDGSYEPSNCRWVTRKVNCNNRRSRKVKGENL